MSGLDSKFRRGYGESASEEGASEGMCSVRDGSGVVEGESLEIGKAVEKVISPRFIVTSNGLNFRSVPSAEGNNPLGKLKRGDQVVLLERKSGWLKIKNPLGDDLAPVYINSKFVAPVINKTSGVTSLGLSSIEEARMASYSESGQQLSKDQNIANRTWDHRLLDHELLIEALLNPETENPQVLNAFDRSGGDLDSIRPALRALHRHFIGEKKRSIREILNGDFLRRAKSIIFFDLGPGIANIDLNKKGDNGKPAITSQEIAERFPQIEVVALDLSSEVDVFTGKKKGSSLDGEFEIPPVERAIAISRPNFHVLAGNALLPLKSQVEDKSNNPYPKKNRPGVEPGAPVIIRAANSIDIYCSWRASNGDKPSVKKALEKMAIDFENNPVILLFNREILFKKKGSKEWSIIGQVAQKGFYSSSSQVSRRKNTPFNLDVEKIDRRSLLWKEPMEIQYDPELDRERITDKYGHGGVGRRERLVNPGDPTPKDLIIVKGINSEKQVYNLFLKKEVADSFIENLKIPAEKEGVFLHISSGFRGFARQESLFSRLPDTAEEPGFSEHQLGTAIDIAGMTRESRGFLWLLKNGFKAGWIPSQYFSPITTVKEPWHWRYVGVEAANKFYQQWKKDIKNEIKSLEALLKIGALRENPDMRKSIPVVQAETQSDIKNTLGQKFIVTIEGLNFRKIPSTKGNQPLGKLRKGTKITLIEDQGEWLKIENPYDPKAESVYVSKKYVSKIVETTKEDEDPIVNLGRAKSIREATLPIFDLNGMKTTPRILTEETRQVELGRIVKKRRSSNAQQEYLTRTYGTKIDFIRTLASKIPPMHPECKMSINLPAYKEGLNIYRALYEYTVRQSSPEGIPINPDYFEINILLNSPNSRTPLDNKTREEIERFKKDYPEYHVHIIEHQFNFNGKPVMGEIYKTIVDTSIYRNLQRPDGVNKERLILRSGGADAKEKSPLFLYSVISNFGDPRVAVYKSESQLSQRLLDACPLYDIIYRTQTGLNRLFTKGKSNLGIGSYSAEVYAKAGGFKKVEIAEDKDIAKRMALTIENTAEFEGRKEMHINALDDPRRGLLSIIQGIPLAKSYIEYGDPEKEKALRALDLTKEVIEGRMSPSMRLTAENLTREMSAFYEQYFNQMRKYGNSLKAYKERNKNWSEEQINNETHRLTKLLFVKLFGIIGIPEESYEFNTNHPYIKFRNISQLKRVIEEKKLPSYQDFLIDIYKKMREPIYPKTSL